QTSIEHAFEECSKQAEKLGLRVTGSEIVGMVPLEAMLEAGRFYLKKQGRSTGVPEKELVDSAVISLGLAEISPFDPQKKIIEYAIADNAKLLRKMSISAFADELSSESPAPGGGSVAALSGAMSASLSSMVASLTFGRKGFEQVNEIMEEVACRAQKLKDSFLQAIDDDTNAFNKIAAAQRMPKDSDEKKKVRDKAMRSAQQEATLVPLKVLKFSLEAIELAEIVAEKGNPNTLSDAGVAALNARAAGDAALYNVLINLPGIADAEFVADVKSRATQMGELLRQRCQNLHEQVLKQLEGA
ncbi:MAG: cyclodeaminase/cyclohydrolase family protein, partial [Candidatus Obscuribacterales bacterium]|nr:cyclodeaminase/cyclohydrolase family protein [Candidatus Obscuribacterales bacterium]